MANVTVTTSFRAAPTPPVAGAFVAPTEDGDGLTTTNSWTIVDDAARTGDVANFDITLLPAEAGYELVAFELAIGTDDGVTETQRVLMGSYLNLVRHIRVKQNRVHRVWMRCVYEAVTASDVWVNGAEKRSAWSAPKEVTTTTGAASITIAPSKTSVLVDEGTRMRASLKGSGYLRPEHEVIWRWSVAKVGEQGEFVNATTKFKAEFSAERTDGSTPGQWNFAPQTVGVSTVQLQCIDKAGVIATATVDLTAVDPAVFFSAPEIFAVSPTSNFTGAPAGAVQYTDLPTALAAVPATGNCWIVLQRGASFSSNSVKISGDTFGTLLISPYGTGADPIVDGGLSAFGQTAVISDIRMQSAYDPSDPVNSPAKSVVPDGINFGAASYASINRCNLSGHDIAVWLSETDNEFSMTDVYITDWGNFAIYEGYSGHQALHGVFAVQNPLTLRKNGKAEDYPWYADHGTYRSSFNSGERSFSKLDFHTTNSWAGGESGFLQSTFRIFGGANQTPLLVTMSQIVSEGTDFTLDATTGNQRPNPTNLIAERIVHVNLAQHNFGVGIEHSGVTLRNIRIVNPDTYPEGVASGMRQFFYFSSANKNSNGTKTGQRDNKNNPIILHGVTVVDLRTTGNVPVNAGYDLSYHQTEAPMLNVAFIDTLEHAPTFPDVAAPDASPVNTTPRWTSHYVGRAIWDQAFDASYAVGDAISATFAPAAGSPAYQAATNAPIDDFYGNIRPLTGASRGAVEPA